MNTNRQTDNTATLIEQDQQRRWKEIETLATEAVRSNQIVTLLNALYDAPEDERGGLCGHARDTAFAVKTQKGSGTNGTSDEKISELTGSISKKVSAHDSRPERKVYERDEDTGIDHLVPYAGVEGKNEIGRLCAASLQDGDESQHLALLELLTHLLPHDGSGWTMWARIYIVKASAELSDRAADLLVATEQRKRRAATAKGALSDDQIDFFCDKMIEMSHSAAPCYAIGLAQHVIKLADADATEKIRATMERMIGALHQDSAPDVSLSEWLLEQAAAFVDGFLLDHPEELRLDIKSRHAEP